jgi:predicted negative regulator of RcsB-dependent stress response
VAKRYTRKELKRPDQFQSFWTRVYEFLKSTTRPLAIGTLAAIVIVAGIFLYANLAEKRRAEGTKALAQALRILNSETTPQLEDPDAQKEHHDGDVPKFKTEAERRDAAIKALDKVVKDWGSSAAGREALLVRAGVNYDLGKLDQALSDYKTFLSKGPKGNLRAVAHEGLGYVYEAKGELDRALEQFRLITSSGDFYRDRALYNQARVMERKGDKPAAQKLYQEILDKSPTTPLRDDISNRLALLQK